MQTQAFIIPIAPAPVKAMLSPEEEKFVALAATIIVNTTIKQANEEGIQIPEV